MKKKFLSYALAVFLAVTSMPMIALAGTGNTPAKGNAAGEGAGVSDPQSAVTATFEDTTIYGTINDKGDMSISYSTLEITLNGAIYAGNLGDWPDVSGWFTGLPGCFEARFQKASNDDSGKSATIEVIITNGQQDAKTGSGEMTITIPADCIEGSSGAVNVTGTVKYSIVNQLTGEVTIVNNGQDATALKVGDTLTANIEGVNDLPGAEEGAKTTYKWYRRDTSSESASNETLIGEEDSYTLTLGDVGHYIRVVVSRSDAVPSNYRDATTAAKVQAPDKASNLTVSVDDTGAITVAGNENAGDGRFYYVVDQNAANQAEGWTVVTTKTDVEAALAGSGFKAMPTLTTADNGKYLVVVDFSSDKVVAYGKSAAINIPDNEQIVNDAVAKVNGMSESAFQYKNTKDGLDWNAVRPTIEAAVQDAIKDGGGDIGVVVDSVSFTPEGADKILDYYRASKGAFLCIQKNKRILHYGYIIKQSL